MLNPKLHLLTNVHLSLPSPKGGQTYLTRESYSYHHYRCDGFDDVGWGCGYRTLQTICSMLAMKTGKDVKVPSIRNVQEILVRIGDKESSFTGSRDWIGSAETTFVIDELFQIPCYLRHITNSERISSRKGEIVEYFKTQGGLIAMGGDQDAASKLIVGVHIADNDELSLLVVDPHCSSPPKSPSDLINRGYVKWQTESEFVDDSFYNLRMPKIVE